MELFTITQIHAKGELDRAEKHYLKHLEAHPSDFLATAGLAELKLMKGQYGAAAELSRKVVDLKPDFEGGWCDLIYALRKLGRTEEAIAVGKTAVEQFTPRWERVKRKGKLKASWAEIAANLLNNYGTTCFEMGQPEEAERVLQRAAEYAPRHKDAHWNLGIARIMQGKWEGWHGYEFGFLAGERKQRPYVDEYRNWSGEDLTGKTILVWGEQGIGDEILFSQCIPDLQKLGGKILFDCHPRLKPIFERSFPGVSCFGTRKDHSPGLFDNYHIDFHCPVGSLPLYFRNHDDQFHGAPFLKARDDQVKAYRDKADGFRIGIAWRGGAMHTGQMKRSMTLEKLLGCFYPLPKEGRDKIKLVCLQYGEGVFEQVDAARKSWGYDIECDELAVEDFEWQADLTASCDLVISVVQTSVHLAGALGVKTLCLTPQGAPWKFPPGPKMPWHASVTQFHQDGLYGWDKPISDIREEVGKILEELAAAEAA